MFYSKLRLKTAGTNRQCKQRVK